MPALLDLVPYLILFLALALALSLRTFIEATQIIVRKLVGSIPLVGDLFAAGFDAVAAPITRVLGTAIRTIDSAIGASWHVTASLVRWFSGEFEHGALATWQLGKSLYGFATHDYISALIHRLTATVRAIEHAAHTALHGVIVINKRADLALRHLVLPRLRAVEHAAEVTLPHDIAALRHRARTLENEYANLNRWLRTHPWTAVTGAFVGAVAIALSRLGLDWLKCDGVGRVGRRLCGGLGNLLLDLLEGVIDVLIVTDLCQLTGLMLDVVESSEVQGVLDELIAGIEALMQCQGVERPPPLAGYWTAPPPMQAWAALTPAQ